MFNFIKKSSSHTHKSNSAISADDAKSVVQNILSKYDNEPPKDKLVNLKTAGKSITIDLQLSDNPETVAPEALQTEIGDALAPYGVNEVNLNVSLTQVKVATSANNKSIARDPHNKLPPVVDAAAPPSNAQENKPSTDEPAITKRAPTQTSLKPHPLIEHIIVVASGKGGVGKSTTAVNIALALQKLGRRVGVLDADIYGPSMPTMLGADGVKPALENQQFVPVDAHGLAMLSIGSLLEGDNMPVAWRGPKATGALMQLFNQTNWPKLDYLVIDMPPGTGDIQLTLAQRIPVTGAVIVTTPQHIALMDAQKGIEMFNKTNIPVIGVVENMALHTCSNCGQVDEIFGAGGGDKLAEQYHVPLLGQLPLASSIREQADKGVPSVIANHGEGDKYAHFYINIAHNIEANIAKFAKKRDDGRIF